MRWHVRIARMPNISNLEVVCLVVNFRVSELDIRLSKIKKYVYMMVLFIFLRFITIFAFGPASAVKMYKGGQLR